MNIVVLLDGMHASGNFIIVCCTTETDRTDHLFHLIALEATPSQTEETASIVLQSKFSFVHIMNNLCGIMNNSTNLHMQVVIKIQDLSVVTWPFLLLLV